MDNEPNASPVPTSVSSAASTFVPLLYYRIPEHGDSIVFAPPDRAIRGSQIRRAFESKTWGEFQDRMPEADFADLFASREDYDDFFVIPGRDDPFDGRDMWVGWADGDYPEWLQAHQEEWIPREILDQWGELEATRLNGDFWIFDPSHLEEIIAQLKEAQIQTERRDDLYFY
jgi:hypothetical protein